MENAATRSHCNKVLHGRSDQKFCNDACRNTFNRNKRAAEKIADHENTPEIFRIIKRNYEILKAHRLAEDLNEFMWIEDNSDVVAEGFNPKFFTNIYEDGKQIWCCVF